MAIIHSHTLFVFYLTGLTKKIARSGSTLAEYSYLADGARLSAVGSDGTGVRYLGSLIYSMASAPDPLAEKYYGLSQFAYCLNNSLLFWDDIGKEPVKLFSGTAIGFVTELKTTGTKSGQKQGLAAANSMLL